MIERISIENFKSLRKVELRFGRLNLLIGPNASGKSNFFDVLRMLQALAGGFAVKDLFEGGVKTVAGSDWLGIRGGLQNAVFRVPGESTNRREASVSVEFKTSEGIQLAYRFGFRSDGRTNHETLLAQGKKVFDYDGKDAFFYRSDGVLEPGYPSAFSGSEMVSAYRMGFAGTSKLIVDEWLKYLLSFQFLTLDSSVLRRYGIATDTGRMQERGEHFANVVRMICAQQATKQAYLSWLRELRPAEIDEVGTKPGADNEPRFTILENGREFTAPALSDGTLRFAALAAAFFQQPMPTVMAIEEVETHLHPSRIRALLDLLLSQSKRANVQVFATTHSPTVIDWAGAFRDEDIRVFHFQRTAETGATEIRPLEELIEKDRSPDMARVGELMTEGWFES